MRNKVLPLMAVTIKEIAEKNNEINGQDNKQVIATQCFLLPSTKYDALIYYKDNTH